jgi:hypothetical protein
MQHCMHTNWKRNNVKHPEFGLKYARYIKHQEAARTMGHTDTVGKAKDVHIKPKCKVHVGSICILLQGNCGSRHRRRAHEKARFEVLHTFFHHFASCICGTFQLLRYPGTNVLQSLRTQRMHAVCNLFSSHNRCKFVQWVNLHGFIEPGVTKFVRCLLNCLHTYWIALAEKHFVELLQSPLESSTKLNLHS